MSHAVGPPAISVVSPKVETAALPGSSSFDAGDVADDPAIWLHPTDRSLSTVIGTDKDPGGRGGLFVFDLAGKLIHTADEGQAVNNVDVRPGFALAGAAVDLVGATNRDTRGIDFFRVDAATRDLVPIGSVASGLASADGFALGRSPTDGTVYAFATDGTGTVRQFALDGSSGTVVGTAVRTLRPGNPVEGVVVDDRAGALYLGEQEEGLVAGTHRGPPYVLWKHGIDPGSGAARTQIDTTGPGGHLTADIEGLAIYQAAGHRGYLLASSQGDSSVAVYDSVGGAHLGSFAVGAGGGGIDRVTETDGIEVTNVALNAAFPRGMLVVHDHLNAGAATSNFKYVAWDAVAAALGQLLAGFVGGSVLDGFDREFYLLNNPDVGRGGGDPFAHYQQFGWREGRDPDALFDTRGYLAANPDVAAAGVEPLAHYMRSGWKEGRDPSADFDTTAYLAAHPDVATAGLNPLQHCLAFGVHEGRRTFAADGAILG